MDPDSSLLVLAESETALAEIGERARGLGFRVLREKLPLDALERSRERGARIGAVVLDPELPVVDLGAALEPLRREAGLRPAQILAGGAQPSEERRATLAAAGVERALWTPIDDAALRFELNRALCNQPSTRRRGATRAPMDWEVEIFQGGRRKRARVYSLSPGGAFLETPRPAMRGAKLLVEVPPVPELGAVELACRVLYTNVPGNVGRSTLPHGMAVAFSDTPPEVRDALGRCVDRRDARFRIAVS